MFCGYICIVYAMRGDYESAAPFVGFAFLLDALDGRIARLTGSESAFGIEFDSLADVISFGLAPAVLAYAWGLSPLGRLGLAAGFLYVSAAAMRLGSDLPRSTLARPTQTLTPSRSCSRRTRAGRTSKAVPSTRR